MKTVIIIGGTKGIGLELTKYYLSKNFNVSIGARTLPKSLKNKKNLIFTKGDFSKEKSHLNIIKNSLKKFKKVNVYINNVGLSDWRPIKKVDNQFLNKMLLTNFYSTVWGCKIASMYLKKGSSIVNISSIAGKRGSKNNSIYSASKFAVNGLTQSLSKEIGEKGIRINSVCPVLIKTPGLMKALKSKYSPASNKIDTFLKFFINNNSAMNRLPTKLEVAKLCYFLSSDEASGITGQNINIDCGVFPQ